MQRILARADAAANRLLESIPARAGHVVVQREAIESCRAFLHSLGRTLALPAHVFARAILSLEAVLPGVDVHDDSTSFDQCGHKLIDVEWLSRLIQLRVALSFRNIQLALSRVSRHIAAIEAACEAKFEKLTAIRHLGVETHNGGCQPLLLEFDHQHRVVYKPASLCGDLILSLVSNHILNPAIRYGLRTPWLVLAGPDYGFREFVPGRETAADSLVLTRFYYRCGALLAAAHVLNLTDLNMENIVADDDTPIIIDAETILYHHTERTDVFQTGMLQRHCKAETARSGLQGGGLARQLRLHERGGWSLYSRVSYYDYEWHNLNRPHTEGALAEPSDHVSAIAAGFEESYSVLCNNTMAMAGILERLLRRRLVRGRHLVRFTSYYIMHLLWFLQPSLGAQHVAQLSRLTADRGADGAVDESMANAERHDLMRGDVPYFWAHINSTKLWHGNHVVAPDYFSVTALESFQAKRASLCPSDCTLQLENIVSALTGRRSDGDDD